MCLHIKERTGVQVLITALVGAMVIKNEHPRFHHDEEVDFEQTSSDAVVSTIQTSGAVAVLPGLHPDGLMMLD